MKSTDALVAAWTQTVGRAKDAPAIFNASGQAVRKFSEIEEHARDFEAKIEMFDVGSVIAIQIGNHEDWPSILIACLRKRLVVLPLEQSISHQQRNAALSVCDASALVSCDDIAPHVHTLHNNTSPNWDGEAPALLNLTSGTTAAPQ